MKSRTRARILLVEDDPVEARRLLSAINHLGHDVALAGDGDAALERLAAEPFDLVLLDLVIPGLDGMGVISAMQARGWTVPVIAAVTTAGMEAASSAIRAGARDFVVKPAGALRLEVAIANAIASRPPPRPAEAPIALRPVAATADETRTALLDGQGHARPLAQVEAAAIRFAVSLYGGRMSEVARRLGIGRSTLYRKLDMLELPVAEDGPGLAVAAE